MIRTKLLVAGLAVCAVAAYAQSDPIESHPKPKMVDGRLQPPILPPLNLTATPESSSGATFPGAVNKQAAFVTPNVAFDTVVESQVQDVHLRPLFETAIRLPAAVSSIAIGAPTLFEAEHKAQEPNIVFVKPSTHQAAVSNLLIAMVNGETVSVRLISPGDAGSSEPVDFVVDYQQPRSLFGGSTGITSVAPVQSVQRHDDGLTGEAARITPVPSFDASGAISAQSSIAAPTWLTAADLTKLIREDARAPNDIAIAIGTIRQEQDNMTVSFSVLNVSSKWVTIMPPQVEITNPLQSKKDKKKNGTFAVPVVVQEYRLQNPKLPPGARADGSVIFTKPESKLAKEGLLLHVATSAAIDTPVYYPLPFVAPSPAEVIAESEKLNVSR
jgi:hypothetical protein